MKGARVGVPARSRRGSGIKWVEDLAVMDALLGVWGEQWQMKKSVYYSAKSSNDMRCEMRDASQNSSNQMEVQYYFY